MGRRRITVTDIKEVLVAWDAGESVSAIARMFGYTRPTVRKYVHAAAYVGLTRGGERRGAPGATIRLDDPPPGEEAQVDFFYVGLWHDPDLGRRRKLYAFLMTLSHSRHQFLYPVLAEDATTWHEGHVKGLAFFGGAPRR